MKLRMLLVVAVATLSLASCKDKKAAPGATGEQAPANAALPPECVAYRDAIAKLADCNALPVATRDALKKAYEAAAAKWVDVPPDGRAALGNSCKAGVEAINKTLASCT